MFFLGGKYFDFERYNHYTNNRYYDEELTMTATSAAAAAAVERGKESEFPIFSLYGRHANEECHIWEPIKESGKHCVSFDRPVYDDNDTTFLLWPANTSWHLGRILDVSIDPHVPECSVWLGRLTFNSSTGKFRCACTVIQNLFTGPHCDNPSKKLVRENDCKRVGWIKNPEITDVSLFDPIKEGICVECSSEGAIPVIDSVIMGPSCLNPRKRRKKKRKPSPLSYSLSPPPPPPPLCVFDALTGQYTSAINKYVSGYGCSCDYHNGYIEGYITGLEKRIIKDKGRGREDDSLIISNVCLKVAKDAAEYSYHRVDILYYTLVNDGRPLQTHTYMYKQLEPSFAWLLSKHNNDNIASTVLLIHQPTVSNFKVHSYDWLNRNLHKHTALYRRDYNNKNTWPAVHRVKRGWVNHYSRDVSTNPISASRLKVDKGFEEKHFYELTNLRYLINNVWRHPIIYGSKNEWANTFTLNSLGVDEGHYVGLTILTSLGDSLQLAFIDTRTVSKDRFPKVIPPDYYHDMISDEMKEKMIRKNRYKMHPIFHPALTKKKSRRQLLLKSWRPIVKPLS